MKIMEKAVILAEGRYQTAEGKTAHGLVRFSRRFDIVGVIDSECAGEDAGEVLDGISRGINIYRSFEDALKENPAIRYLIIGVATAGGKLPESYKTIVINAIINKISIINGLHLFLSDDPEFSLMAEYHNADIIDVRKIFRDYKVFYDGRRDEVSCKKIAVLGTDSAIGKRTTAIMLHQAFEKIEKKSVFIAMGQTGWMQGFKYCIVLDAIVLDFVTGAIEYIIWKAWKEENPDFIITHGEGAMLHPACPGGFELIAAGKPDYIVLQHSPARKHYDDFPQYTMDSLSKNIRLIEVFSGKKPIAITINSEQMTRSEALQIARKTEADCNILTRVPLYEGVEDIVSAISML